MEKYECTYCGTVTDKHPACHGPICPECCARCEKEHRGCLHQNEKMFGFRDAIAAGNLQRAQQMIKRCVRTKG